MLILPGVFVAHLSSLVVASLVVETPSVEQSVAGEVRVVMSIVVVLTVVVALVPIGRIRSEWYLHAPILLPSTLPVGLVIVFGMTIPEVAYAPLIGFLPLELGIIPITNEQKSPSLVFPSELRTVSLSKLLPTVAPNRKLHLHKRR